MNQDIPLEARAAIEEFNRQETERAAARQSGPKDKDRRLEEVFEGKKVRMNAQDVEQLAARLGITVESGGGKHGKHLVGPDGQRCSLPDHGGRDLAIGTLRAIIDFLSQFRK